MFLFLNLSDSVSASFKAMHSGVNTDAFLSILSWMIELVSGHIQAENLKYFIDQRTNLKLHKTYNFTTLQAYYTQKASLILVTRTRPSPSVQPSTIQITPPPPP